MLPLYDTRASTMDPLCRIVWRISLARFERSSRAQQEQSRDETSTPQVPNRPFIQTIQFQWFLGLGFFQSRREPDRLSLVAFCWILTTLARALPWMECRCTKPVFRTDTMKPTFRATCSRLNKTPQYIHLVKASTSSLLSLDSKDNTTP